MVGIIYLIQECLVNLILTEYKDSLVVIGKGLLNKVEKQGEDEYIF